MTICRKVVIPQIIPLYSPRSSYKKIKSNDEKMIANMTVDFDKFTISLIRQQFNQRNNRLNEEQFIAVVKKYLKFRRNQLQNRDESLVRYLSFLFNQITIKGKQFLEWNEFTSYLIQRATALKTLKSKTEQIKHYIRSKIRPRIKTDNIIQKSEYIEDMNKIAFFQQGSNKILFMYVQTGQISDKSINIDPKKLIVNISSVKKYKTGKSQLCQKDLVLPTEMRVLDMVYLPENKYKMLMVSTSDGFIRGWKYNQNGFTLAMQPDNEQQILQHGFTNEIYCMAWEPVNEILFCGQQNGNIFSWNLKTDVQLALCQTGCVPHEKQYDEQKVSMMITCIITMPKLQFMASGRMDGKVILWDIINGKKKWVYTEHARGILTLAFNEEMILLFSAGFDHKICIWNPYISSLIHKIQGHLAPIFALRVVQRTHQLISVDCEGIVKITDTRHFNLIDSFSVSTQDGSNFSRLSSLMIINKPLKLVFTGKSIYMYEYDKNYHPNTADDKPALCCRYMKDKFYFFTPMGNKIKVWSALNGDVERVYMDITAHQISIFQFDLLKKRMIIGDIKGNITVHNSTNGAKLKNLTKHNGQITHLIVTHNQLNTEIFISCSLDNEIRIFKQTQQFFEVIRTISIIKQVIVTCLDYCPINKLIIVGSNVGTLGFYDIETGKTAGTCFNNSYESFTGLCRTKSSMLITGSSSGKITIIAMPPLPNRFERVFCFYHEDCQKVEEGLGVRFISYSDELQQLFIIDEKMYLTCYSFAEIEAKNVMYVKMEDSVESIKRLFHTKIFQQAKIKILWQVKTHQQLVKSLQLIHEEKLLVTTSIDRKIKFWYAETGEYIDSLQQNYNKNEVTPIAYYNMKNSSLYSYDHKIIKQIEGVDTMKLQFDPFIIETLLQQNRWLGNSNHEWKLNVNFRQVVQEQIDKVAKLVNVVKNRQQKVRNSKIIQNPSVDLSKIVSRLDEQRRMLKLLLNENKTQPDQKQLNQNKQLDENENTQSSTNFLKIKSINLTETFTGSTSVSKLSNGFNQLSKLSNSQNKDPIKCGNCDEIANMGLRKNSLKYLQKCIIQGDKQVVGDNGMRKKQKSHRDFVPIYQMLKNKEKDKQQIEEHNKYINGLSKRPTQSSLNHQVDYSSYYANHELESAHKLFKIFTNVDEQTYIKNGKISLPASKRQKKSNQSRFRVKSQSKPNKILPKLF